MLSQSNAGSASPASSLGTTSEVEPSPVLAEHSVCSCSNDDHRALKADIYATREYAANGSSEPLAYPMSEREAAWWRTARPWPGTGFLIGECSCRSSIMICTECEGHEEIELVNGRVVTCDCARDDVEYDLGPRIPRLPLVATFDHFMSEAALVGGCR